MIVSNQPNRSNTRRLQACVLLLALVVLPLGVGCQEGGSLTSAAEQSAIEAELLTAEAEAAAQQCDEASMRRIRARLGAAVEAGVMSREDAGRRFRAFAASCKARGGEGRNAECTELGANLRELIAAGEISGEDARARYAASGCAASEERSAECTEMGRKLREMVAAGEVSAEDAKARYQASGCAANTDSSANECKVRVRTRIGQGVKAGTIPREEAKARYAAAVAEHCRDASLDTPAP